MTQIQTFAGQALYDFARAKIEVIKIDNLGNAVVIDCTGANAVSIQATIIEGAWGSGVLAIQRSNDGENWYALSTPTTITADGITDITPTTNFLRVYVTTAGSANDRVRIAASARLS